MAKNVPLALHGTADPMRSARLQMPGPVQMFWLQLGAERDALMCCIAYCEACKRSDRSWFGIDRLRNEGADEREALQRLIDRYECPHTAVAETLLALQQLEEPTR